MRLERSSGVLLHPTSLPGPFGIGDLGPRAYRFADFLAAAGVKIWQVLPLGPTGYGNSPYQSFSAFAGNPLLLSPEMLAADGLLADTDISSPPDFPAAWVDFPRVIAWKRDLLERAYSNFRPSSAYHRFCEEQRPWLDDFARFMAFKEANGHVAWTRWDARLQPGEELAGFHRFLQFKFFEQWFGLHRYCRSRNIRVMGDIPIYVAHDSADVWSNRAMFDLAPDGTPRYVAGVPPDYFSATGQLWGNPIYRWDAMAENGFGWWIERFRATFQMVDIVRLDHFRGFEAYWQVAGSELTAVNGRWIKAPGEKLFEALAAALGELPIVAENLGVITPEVEAIRMRFGFPGMSILQFAFGRDPQGPSFRPHNYVRDLFAYTGTHDNDTTIGWWTSQAGTDSTRSREDIEAERAFCCDYLNSDGTGIHWDFIRAILASVAVAAIIPMQDLLGLGSEARMNLPGDTTGHWMWRCHADAITNELAGRLGRLVKLYDR